MKIYNYKELLIRMNMLEEILKGKKIEEVEMQSSEVNSVLNIRYTYDFNKVTIQYICEVDEDEETGYWTKCRIIENSEVIYNEKSLDSLIQKVKAMN